MDDKKCIICGLNADEGRQLCRICEKSLTPYKEQLAAAFKREPVEYEGDKYGCISAFIIRFRAASRAPLKKRCIFQVELMSAKTNSVIYADPEKVKIIKEWRPPNE